MAFKDVTDVLLRILIGGWDMSLEILLIVMMLDYLTGVASAFRNKTVNSSVGYKGASKKVFHSHRHCSCRTGRQNAGH